MRLYLMQHGEAMSKAENPERPLNEQGRQNVANVAAEIFLQEIDDADILRAEALG